MKSVASSHRTRRRSPVLWLVGGVLALACCTPVRAAQPASGLLLAEGGHARVPVVISPTASESTKAVAAELAQYLGKISGATFQVATGDGSTGIVLGTLAEFPDPGLERPLELRGPGGFDGREAYAVRTEPARLRLIGATDLGASHAAFALLESLGCRWFFQAPEWEVVPATPSLRVELNRDDRPAVLARRIWYGYGMFEYGPESRPVRDYANWSRRNRMAQSFTVNCGHAWQTIIFDNKATFEQHPEYLALVGGKRQGEQLCVSNAAVRDLAVRWAVDHFRKNPSSDMVSVDCSDGDGQCECDACAKLGSISDRVFGLANDAARAVAKEHPGKMVGLLAYNQHCEPPSFALEPNVYVQLTAGFIRGRYTFEELLELWPQKCGNMGYYEYFSVWLWDFDQLPGGRGADVGYLRKQLARYAALGATSIDCESGDNWGPHGRGYYVANRLMWDPKADVDAILTDFYEKAFGPAAPPMRRYYERFDPGAKPLMSEHLLGLGFRDVEAASKLAGGRPDVQARLDHVKQYLRYVHLKWLADRAADKAKKKELTLAALTHAYRTRYGYMNHWEAMRQGWTTQAATDFGEPAWAFNDPTPNKPWAVDRPYTREETDAAFREGLAYFKPDESIRENPFSGDLVPVDFGGSATAAGAPPESVQHYQGGARYALYSGAGEPLTLSVVTGTIAWYRDRAPAGWAVSDAAGKRLAGGKLPLDGQPHSIEVNVPGPGLYFFEFDDSAAGWQIKVAPGRRAAIVLDKSRGFMHAGWMQPMHFYVPRGTRELQYYWSGGPHKVHGPDGALIRAVTASGTFVKIPVPDGADGTTWHFTELALGHLWFFNAPNYLAASPAALLVPRELAARDELPLTAVRADSSK
jgi:hypothetical protein